MKLSRIALAAAAGLLGAAPLSAQLPPELAAFDAQVPGDLINDPTRIDWDSYGSDYETDGRTADDIPGGGAARIFDIKAKGENPYSVAANVPLLDQISSGDRVTVGFYARTVSSDRSDGNGVIGVRFQENAAPYGGFGDTTLTIGNEWEWYEVSAVSNMRIRQSDAIVALQLAGEKQKVEIGQAIVVKGAQSIVTTVPAAPQAALVDADTIEMPDPLRGAGLLANDPTNRRWGHSGDGGRWEDLDVPEIWLGKATRFTSDSVGENRWDLGTAIPINTPISVGEEFTIAIIARTLSAETDDGKGLIYGRLQGTMPPYPGFGDKVFKVGDRWQMIRLPFTATREFSSGGATLALHFAAAKQSVEIGPVYVFKSE